MPNLIIDRNVVIFVTLWLWLSAEVCESMRFDLASGATKCISEEIQHDAMTVGKYNVITPIDGHPIPDTHRITARVTSPRGNHYHYKEVVESGNFAFTAADTGDYMICFWAPRHNLPTKISIDFEWKTGIDARDWFNVARKGQIDLLDVELKRLYDGVKSIRDEMFHLREREEEMQLLNKSTKSKMATFSFISIILVMSVAALQIWHLKTYFERKKLL
ncbi:transmembrane emp24 domain-containing protein p24delta7-like [Spinacia oleracea]|uniref:Transmembrane emp24 domain-containing protein p24delta7-like n=1 Tax=Spinacia oleracea TaxID=3562 RepID=A0A9R0JCQ9_SPIOL|nr:transmembrane emp24 domain-containing protein p24delta7-like [Spinacia oleracea]